MKVFWTDTHFGKYNNNITFFEGQKSFVYNEFIPWLKKLTNEYDNIEVVHCGDVFDSRSTLSIYIANEVQKMFDDIYNIVNKITIIGGNHDYLQQVDTGKENFNSVDLIFREKPYYISTQQDIPVDEYGVAYVNFNNWTYEKLKQCIDNQQVRSIVAHTDISKVEPQIAGLLKDITVISGHIHQPKTAPKRYNLGSCFPIDFADANSVRYAYLFDDTATELVDKLPNTKSVQFYRIYDDKVLDFDISKCKPSDRVEVYITKNQYVAGTYNDEIEKINEYFKASVIIPYTVETNPETNDVINFEEYDIEKIIEDMMPEEYWEHFERLKAAML